MTETAGTRLLGGLVRAVGRHGSVLCFHGLRENDDQVDSVMNLTLGAFGAAMDLVRASAEIVPLDDLHHRWSQGQSTRGLVAITFDDAYASLLETADRWYIPAPFPITVFVVTGASATGEAFWWDRLEALAEALSAADWERLEAACGMPLPLRGQADPVLGPLQGIRQWILQNHKGRASPALGEALGRLESSHNRRTTQRAMRADELERLARLGPVSFGVHTVTHPVLPVLSPEEGAAEIREAWKALQEWSLPSRTPILAIPFGMSSAAIPNLSRACGMGASLALDDQTMRRHPQKLEAALMSRLSMVQRTTPVRLAYRLSGLRDFAKRGSAQGQSPAPGLGHEN